MLFKMNKSDNNYSQIEEDDYNEENNDEE
jgi:hypothetical protein